ncbi:MAG: tetratricopeptide repeat protein, partial [Bacteroidales bacterium]|nr:tetratricopeptide repeat protein [Bacteroidales bacterium]
MVTYKHTYRFYGQVLVLSLTFLMVFGSVWLYGKSGSSGVDSLISQYKNASNDSLRAESFYVLVVYLDSTGLLSEPAYEQYRNTSVITAWVNNAQQAQRIAYKLDRMGVNNRNNGHYLLAIRLHETALLLAQKSNNTHHQSIILNNIGVVYRRLDHYEKSMSFHIQALNLAESHHDSANMAVAINSMGNIQESIGNLDEAERLFKKSYAIENGLNNRLGIAINLNNMGNIYEERGQNSLAKEYYFRSLKANEEINNNKGIAICYNDLGIVFQKDSNYIKALEYLQSALEINQKLNEKNNLAYSYIKLGELYFEMGQNAQALKHLIPGLMLSKEINSKYNIVEAYTSLYKIEYRENRYKKALDYLQLAHQYHDSILNLNIQKEIARLQISFDSERQASQINSLNQQASISLLEIKRQKTINLLFVVAFILTLIIVAFLSFYLHSKNNTNKLLIEKNKIIEQTGIELDKYTRQLLIAKKEAEKNNQTKSEFLANMS